MTNLRKAIIFMVIFLVIFFNVERLDYSGQNLIDLHTFVYVLVSVAVLGTLYGRYFKRFSVYFAIPFWLILYMVLKVLVFTNRPVLGNIYTYLTITEMALIAVAVFLAYDLARAISDFEDVIEKVTFPKRGVRVMAIKEASEEIKTELIRSRRHNRPLSVMVVEMDPSTSRVALEKAMKNFQQTMLTRYLLASLAQILTREARRTDIILEQADQEGFILLCPETTAQGSSILANRIRSLAVDRLGISVKCGMAAFPDEALTFEELLQRAHVGIAGPKKIPNLFSYDKTNGNTQDRRKQ